MEQYLYMSILDILPSQGQIAQPSVINDFDKCGLFDVFYDLQDELQDELDETV